MDESKLLFEIERQLIKKCKIMGLEIRYDVLKDLSLDVLEEEITLEQVVVKMSERVPTIN